MAVRELQRVVLDVCIQRLTVRERALGVPVLRGGAELMSGGREGVDRAGRTM